MEIKPEDLLITGYKNMAFKTASVTDSITAISSKGLKLYYKRLYHNLKLKTDSDTAIKLKTDSVADVKICSKIIKKTPKNIN